MEFVNTQELYQPSKEIHMALAIGKQAKKLETWTCRECGAAVNLGEARLRDGRPVVGTGLFRGLLAASVMTAFFGLLVLIGFTLGKLS